MPHIEILSQDARQVTLRDTEGNLVHLLQDDSPCSGGDVDKTDMFTGTFTGVLYEDDLAAAQSFYCWSGRQMRCCSGPAMHSCCCAGVRQAAPWVRL